MEIIHSCKIKDYTIVVSPKFLAIEHNGDAIVTLVPEDAYDLIGWLNSEWGIYGHAKPFEVVKTTPVLIVPPAKPFSTIAKVVDEKPLPDFSDRSYAGKFKPEDGPTLVAPPNASQDGKQRVVKVGVTDLASEAAKGAVPTTKSR